MTPLDGEPGSCATKEGRAQGMPALSHAQVPRSGSTCNDDEPITRRYVVRFTVFEA